MLLQQATLHPTQSSIASPPPCPMACPKPRGRTWPRASASWRCSASGLSRLLTATVFLMPSARLPKRRLLSVSAALSAQGEQLMSRIVRALPPWVCSACACLGVCDEGRYLKIMGAMQAPQLLQPCSGVPAAPPPYTLRQAAAPHPPSHQRVLQHARQLGIAIRHVRAAAAAAALGQRRHHVCERAQRAVDERALCQRLA